MTSLCFCAPPQKKRRHPEAAGVPEGGAGGAGVCEEAAPARETIPGGRSAVTKTRTPRSSSKNRLLMISTKNRKTLKDGAAPASGASDHHSDRQHLPVSARENLPLLHILYNIYDILYPHSGQGMFGRASFRAAQGSGNSCRLLGKPERFGPEDEPAAVQNLQAPYCLI